MPALHSLLLGSMALFWIVPLQIPPLAVEAGGLLISAPFLTWLFLMACGSFPLTSLASGVLATQLWITCVVGPSLPPLPHVRSLRKTTLTIESFSAHYRYLPWWILPLGMGSTLPDLLTVGCLVLDWKIAVPPLCGGPPFLMRMPLLPSFLASYHSMGSLLIPSLNSLNSAYSLKAFSRVSLGLATLLPLKTLINSINYSLLGLMSNVGRPVTCICPSTSLKASYCSILDLLFNPSAAFASRPDLSFWALSLPC